MALTAKQLEGIGLHTSITREQQAGQRKDPLMPIDHFDNRPVMRKPAPSEYRADQWHSADKSLPKKKVSEWACKPY